MRATRQEFTLTPVLSGLKERLERRSGLRRLFRTVPGWDGAKPLKRSVGRPIQRSPFHCSNDPMTSTHPIRLPLAVACLAALVGCTTPPQEAMGPLAKEEIVAVSTSHFLLRFNAGQPQKVRDRKAIAGLRAGERLVGMDYRVARGELYALGATGQLYRIDVAQARATPVGTGAALPGGTADTEWGFDFNPTVDRIRVVNRGGLNMRLHPDTGAQVDGDASLAGVQADSPLAYEAGDTQAGRAPAIVAAGYTYNKTNDKITTNYAIDGAAGTLVRQGSREGETPLVSPNTGLLVTVGNLGLGPLAHATLDISDLSDTAYSAAWAPGGATRWYRVDLATGRASFIGTVGMGENLIGAAIEP
jgi:Domain of unknown function (DUF4394)